MGFERIQRDPFLVENISVGCGELGLAENAEASHVFLVPPAIIDRLATLARDPALLTLPHDQGPGDRVDDSLVIAFDGRTTEHDFTEPLPEAVKPLVAALEDLAAHPPAPPKFDVTLDEDGKTLRATSPGSTLTELQIVQIAMALEDPAFAHAASSDGAVRLRSTGDVSIDLRYPPGHGPAAAMALQKLLEQILLPPRTTSAIGEPCGTVAGIHCDDGLVCDYDGQTPCTASDWEGTCRAPVTSCPSDDAPVCACGGTTYPNDCERQLAHAPLDHKGPC